MNESERTLWRRWAKRRDENAFAALVAAHERFVYDFARRVSEDAAEAEDLAQQAFLDLAEAPGDRPLEVGVRPFLGRRVVLGARTLRRASLSRARRHREAAKAAEVRTTQEPGMHHDAEAALALLDPEGRHAVILRFLHDLSFRDVAHTLGVSEPAARMRVHRALSTLRERLGPAASASIAALTLATPPPELGQAIVATATHALGAMAMTAATKKTALLVLLLLVFVSGSLVAIASLGDPERAARKSRTGDETGAVSPATSPSEPAADGRAALREESHADPNRVPGPDLTVEGIVLLHGAGVQAAEITALRSYPEVGQKQHRVLSVHRRLVQREPAQPLVRTTTGPDGRFRLSLSRRRSLVVEVRHADAAVKRILLRAPEVGDPDSIRIQLEPGCSLRGRVVKDNGQPLEKARVCVYRMSARLPPAIHTALTDGEGAFAMDGLGAGRASLEIMAKGFASHYMGVQLPSETEILATLRPGGVVHGTVTDDTGAPLAHATLSMTTLPGGGDVGHALTETDDAGSYRIDHIAPGVISRVILDHGEYGSLDSVLGRIRLQPGHVRAGETARYDVTVDAGSTVAGRVVRAEDERPVAGARVTLARLEGIYRYLSDKASTATGPDGMFVFRHVLRGSYAIEALAPGAARLIRRRALGARPPTLDFHLEDGVPVEEQRVVLEPVGRVRGRVLHGGSADVSRSSAELKLDGERGPRAEVDAAGAFEFPHVPPSENAQVRLFRPSATSKPFAVEAGRTVDVTIDLSDREDFHGVVLDREGAPVHGATVGALLQRRAGWLPSLSRARRDANFTETRTDLEGKFVLPVFVPAHQTGRQRGWAVFARHPAYAPTALDSVKLPGEEDVEGLKLVLQPGEEIAGRVETQDGSLVPNAWVYLNPVYGKGTSFRPHRQSRAGGDGRFVFRGLAAGEFKLRARATFGQSEDVTARAGDREVALCVARQQWISGTVVYEDGRPVVGAEVKAVSSSREEERGRSASTDRSGRFNVRNLDEGDYSIAVSPGDASGTGGWFATEKRDAVPAGTDGLVIRVSPGFAVSGRVIAPDGKAVGGAGIMAVPRRKKDEPDKRARNAHHPHAFTGPRGEFKLTGLSEQPLDLWVVASGHPPHSMPVAPGDEGLTIELARGGVLAGVLLGPTGQPLADRSVRVEPVDEETKQHMQEWGRRGGSTWNRLTRWKSRVSRSTDRAGRFRFGELIAGEYRFDVREPGLVVDAVTVRTDDPDIVLRLYEPLTIQGRVVGPGGKPLKPLITVVDGKGNPIEHLSAAVGVNASRGERYLASAKVLPDGSFEIQGLPPGPVILKAYANGYAYKVIETKVHAGDRNLLLRFAPRPGSGD